MLHKNLEIKDKIIDFALTPFRKIKELFENLVINILESLEGIPSYWWQSKRNERKHTKQEGRKK